MRRLNLAIADSDEEYGEGLSGFLTKRYSLRMNVKCFTSYTYLRDYLSVSKEKIDILLASADIYREVLAEGGAGLVILLHDGQVPEDFGECPHVLKYQHADKLAAKVLELYSAAGMKGVFEGTGKGKAFVCAVFSPSGGCGKTSIALTLSICLAQKGHRVFYLNLEPFSSTPFFFKNDSDKGLSQILYHLKGKDDNLALRIETARCMDATYGIHYFLPPDHVLELSEASPEEITVLIEKLRTMGDYDHVLVDLPAGFDRTGAAVLEASDEILIVTLLNDMSLYKLKLLSKQLELLSQKTGDNLSARTDVVINRCSESTPCDNALYEAMGKTSAVKIPEDALLAGGIGAVAFLGTESPFFMGVSRLSSILNSRSGSREA